MMFWYGHGMSSWGYGLMVTSMVFFWGLVIAAGALLVRHFRRTSIGVVGAPTAQQILDGRFARGEIDHDEYASRRTALRTES